MPVTRGHRLYFQLCYSRISTVGSGIISWFLFTLLMDLCLIPTEDTLSEDFDSVAFIIVFHKGNKSFLSSIQLYVFMYKYKSTKNTKLSTKPSFNFIFLRYNHESTHRKIVVIRFFDFRRKFDDLFLIEYGFL